MKALCVLLPLLLASQVLQAMETHGAPEADGAKVIRLTSHLENYPLSDTDKSIRKWLLQWLIETKEITVVVCEILGANFGEELPHNGIYALQMAFGNAAYQIAHPDKRGDMLATQLAAARSSLKAYGSILEEHPEARIPHFDELLSKDKSGNLESYLAPVVTEKCNDSGGA